LFELAFACFPHEALEDRGELLVSESLTGFAALPDVKIRNTPLSWSNPAVWM
jgi:hypothetical protein